MSKPLSRFYTVRWRPVLVLVGLAGLMLHVGPVLPKDGIENVSQAVIPSGVNAGYISEKWGRLEERRRRSYLAAFNKFKTIQDCLLSPGMPLESAKIDWLRVDTEEAAEYCLLLITRAYNNADAVAQFIERNGLILSRGNPIPRERTISGYLRVSGFREAGKFFGYQSWWALQLLHPVNLVVAAIASPTASLKLQIQYNPFVGLEPTDIQVRYGIEIK